MKTPNLPERSPVLERLSGAPVSNVPKTGIYPLGAGDKVVPVKDAKKDDDKVVPEKKDGRSSEYRKVFLARKKKKKD